MRRRGEEVLCALGVVGLATASRQQLDLGSLVPAGAVVGLVIVGSLCLCAGAPALWARADLAPARVGTAGGLALGLGLIVPVPGIRVAAAAAVVATLLRRRRPNYARRLDTVAIGGLLVAGAAWAAEWLCMLRAPFDAVAVVPEAALRVLGVSAGRAGDTVVVDGCRGFQGFLVFANSTGLAVMASVCLLPLVHRWVDGPRFARGWRSALRATAWLAVALTLRFLLVAAVGLTAEAHLDFDDVNFPVLASLGWRTTAAIDATVAIVVALGVFPVARAAIGNASSPLVRWPVCATCAIVAGILLGGDRSLDSVGARKGGRLAIDERHSRWEATDLRLGHHEYGTESGYNFRALADWFAQGYGPVRRLYESTTEETLREIDVLVIKTPTERFTAEERQAIRGFVDNGGGLLLVGDHTNVFGTGQALNEITRDFGFRFDFDCLFDQQQTFEEIYHPEGLVRGHPVIATVPLLRFEVGCSIDIDSTDVRPVIVGRGLKSQPIDFTRGNFYPSVQDQSQLRYGQFPQLVVRTYGQGRVAAIADSTLFSTFSVCLTGRREVLEGMVAWLNHEDVGEATRQVVRRSGAIMLIVLLLVIRGQTRERRVALFLGVPIAAWLVVVAFETAAYEGAPRIARGRAAREVHVVSASDKAQWPVNGFIRSALASYDLSFQWITRTGRFPRLIESLDDAMATDAPLLLFDPTDPGTEATQRLLEFIRRGYTVVAFESAPNALLERLGSAAGMRLTHCSERPRGASSRYGPIDFEATQETTRHIEGGAPLLRATESGNVLAAVAELGSGRLALVCCGAQFSNAGFGYSYHVVPDASRRRLYEFYFRIIEAAASDRAEEDSP